MAVQVMIKRKWQVDKPEKLLPLLTKLRAQAKQQPGYISSETLRSLDDPADLLVIGTWESVEDWNRWLQSKERRDLQHQVDSLIGEKTFYEVFEPLEH